MQIFNNTYPKEYRESSAFYYPKPIAINLLQIK